MGEDPSDALVLTRRVGAVAQVTLNRPAARNAIDLDMGRAVDRALTAAEDDPDVRVIVLAAAGPVFCAGADLKALRDGAREAFVDDRGWAGITRRAGPVPLVAAVEGPALGGGCEIVLACDLAVASRTATFGLPEIRHGLLAAAGGAARLPGVIGRKAALEMLLTGAPIDATRAFALGLLNRVVEPGEALAVATELADAIAGNGAAAVTAARRVVRAAVTDGEPQADRLATELLEELLASEHARGRLQAFSGD